MSGFDSPFSAGRQFARAVRPLTRIGAAVALVLAAGSGCRAVDTPLAPVSPEAAHVASLWWIFFGVACVIYLAVIGTLVAILWRKRRVRAATPAPDLLQRGVGQLVVAATILTVLTLFVLLVMDFRTGRRLDRRSNDADPLTIKITGHQWWWEIEYDDPAPTAIIQSANELHLPAGRPVRLLLRSADVIHSFWIPSLQGKKDLIPGHPTTLWLHPRRTGRFQGQCAEFCGYQHAHMGLVAVVESPEDFARWQTEQRRSARAPAGAATSRGLDVFLNSSCVLCHTIGGTPAGSRVGPPLTHIASRETLAAGALRNGREELRRWILDPQSVKPGVRMPATPLAAPELEALLDYLQSLK